MLKLYLYSMILIFIYRDIVNFSLFDFVINLNIHSNYDLIKISICILMIEYC